MGVGTRKPKFFDSVRKLARRMKCSVPLLESQTMSADSVVMRMGELGLSEIIAHAWHVAGANMDKARRGVTENWIRVFSCWFIVVSFES